MSFLHKWATQQSATASNHFEHFILQCNRKNHYYQFFYYYSICSSSLNCLHYKIFIVKFEAKLEVCTGRNFWPRPDRLKASLSSPAAKAQSPAQTLQKLVKTIPARVKKINEISPGPVRLYFYKIFQFFMTQN